MKFEYDPKKSLGNKEKHGVDFEEAQLIWMSSYVILPAKVTGEPRFMIIGRIVTDIYSCIFTLRHEKVIRIISCRRSRTEERKVYYEKIK